jgi:hypothetical protein
MTMSLAAMLLLVCILQIGSLGNQTIQTFSKVVERPPSPPTTTWQTDYSPYNEWRMHVWRRSGGSNPSNGDSGMDPEQYQT